MTDRAAARPDRPADRPADRLTIAVAQLNPTVGDVDGNTAKVRQARREAAALEADLVAFPELFVAGYPPEDLVLKPAFQSACRAAVEALAGETADGGPAVLVGTPWAEDGKLYNAYCLLDGGRIAAVRYKVNLPNYGVFDERRVFAAGQPPGPVSFRGVRIGIPVCEDIWTEWGDYEDVVECLTETGAELLLVPNGSPYSRDKDEVRLNVVVARVTESRLPLLYVNQICGQDELVFDGASFGLNADRSLAFRLPAFRECVETVVFERGAEGWHSVDGPIAPQEEDGDRTDYTACVLGLRDYVEKNRFPGVVIGLSGGVDSALCAAMAVDAIGAERVRCVMLPYRYTSEDSKGDAAKLAEALGVRYDVVPIAPAVEGLEAAVAPLFDGLARDVTEENLQARARGVILMAVSNKFGLMVVTTGNKSEMSCGYATLYGDMNGGFNPLKDLYKTEVYRLAWLRNTWKPEGALGPDGRVIPDNIMIRPPTAELRENQTDQDSLPPYDILDAVLERLVEREEPIAKIVADGFDAAMVSRVERMLNVAEYKRRQAAPGVKVTLKNFGRDRRYPITNRFRDRGEPLPEPQRDLVAPHGPSRTETHDL
ncbi:NAD+ synthase [Rhodovulum sp. PH10]|uniref:NAD+ synthase n=1 Tax=Rhodovulum sp. PH10 TaxID=1187851 RepID=UPI000A065500|nr:NAD+ synthase [Rhodovulum sp. PH10]